MSLVYFVLAVAVLTVVVLFFGPKPWHEYAYGTSLSNLAALPHAVSQFLSLPALDSSKIRIETSISSASNGSDDIGALATYLNGRIGSRPGGSELVSELMRINMIPDTAQKVNHLLTTLIQSKDLIRDDAHQDDVIMFIHYYLKSPSSLDSDLRTTIASMIGKMDSAKNARLFEHGKCPEKLLHGNINIYPLSMEDTSWYKVSGLSGDPTRPILEIRFMGLKGIFQYLLDSMSHTSGLSFVYLDGDKLSPQ